MAFPFRKIDAEESGGRCSRAQGIARKTAGHQKIEPMHLLAALLRRRNRA